MSKLEKLKQIQLRAEELSMLALVGDRFTSIEKDFNEIEEILHTHLDRYVGLLECFQRGYMEIENIREEIAEQIHNMRDKIFSNAEQEEEE